MSSVTEFNCNFCSNKITSGATIHGQYGVCLAKSFVVTEEREWSRNCFENLQGPHICGECISSILESKAYTGEY